MAPSSFGKREREQAKRAKAQAKQQRRQRGGGVSPDEEPQDDVPEAQPAPGIPESTDDLLEQIAELHRRYDAGALTFEDFEAQKADLLARLVVD